MINTLKENEVLFDSFLEYFIERFTYEAIHIEGLTLQSAREREIKNYIRVFSPLSNPAKTIGEIDFNYIKEHLNIKATKFLHQTGNKKISELTAEDLEILSEEDQLKFIDCVDKHNNLKVRDIDVEFFMRPHLKVERFITKYKHLTPNELDERQKHDYPSPFKNDLDNNMDTKIGQIEFSTYNNYRNYVYSFMNQFSDIKINDIKNEIYNVLPIELKNVIDEHNNLQVKHMDIEPLKTLTKHEFNFINKHFNTKVDDITPLDFENLSSLFIETINLHKIGANKNLNRYDVSVIGQAVNRFRGIEGYRKIDVLTGANFEAADKNSVLNELDYLLNNYNNLDEEMSPFEKEAYLLINLIRIHPFEDGNKRTAKLIMNMNLIKQNILPIVIFENQTEEFYSYIENNDIQGFAKLLEIQSEREMTNTVGYLKQQAKEKDQRLLNLLILRS